MNQGQDDGQKVDPQVAVAALEAVRRCRQVRIDCAGYLINCLDLQKDKMHHLRPAVHLFAQVMEYVLRQNDHKPDFTEDVPALQMWALEDEVHELRQALHEAKDSTVDGERLLRVLWEAADVAVCSLIIACNVGALNPTEPHDGRGRAFPVGATGRGDTVDWKA